MILRTLRWAVVDSLWQATFTVVVYASTAATVR